MEDSPDFDAGTARQEPMPEGRASHEPDSPAVVDSEAGRAPIPDDCLVTVDLRGYGTGVTLLYGGVLYVLCGSHRDIDETEEFGYTLERLTCEVRAAKNPSSEDDGEGELIDSFELELSEEQIEEEEPPLPILSGTGGVATEEIRYLLHGITARYGDVLQMEISKTAVTIGKRTIGLDEFAMERTDWEWDIKEWYISGIRFSYLELVLDLDLVIALVQDIDYILRYTQNPHFRTPVQIFEDNPFWYSTILEVVAAMPSERRKHIICYQNKLAEALRRAVRSGWIPEPAP